MRKKVFKMLAVLCVAAMIVAMTACSNTGKNTQNTGAVDKNKQYILVGRVCPLTGALASFGKGTPFVEEKAVEELNKQGGIYLEEYGRKLPIKFIVADSESSTTKASEAATKLILQDKVDIMITSHTVDTVNPVSAACERYQIPCISVDAPVDAWLDGGPYTYSYHAHFNTQNELSCFADAWDLVQSNKKIGLLAANDAEGIEIATKVQEFAKTRGYTVVDPGRFTSGTSDYTSIINDLKRNDCDIIMGVMITPDFATFWKQCHQQGYVPKVCTIAKATLFEADVKALGGTLGDGVVSEIWWTPNHPFTSSLTGQTSKQLGEVWLNQYKDDVVVPPTMGYKHANVELLVDILTRAKSLDKQKILDAAAATDLDTCIGHVKYEENHACVMNLVTGQWVLQPNGTYKQEVIANSQIPNCPTSAKIKILPGCTQK